MPPRLETEQAIAVMHDAWVAEHVPSATTTTTTTVAVTTVTTRPPATTTTTRPTTTTLVAPTTSPTTVAPATTTTTTTLAAAAQLPSTEPPPPSDTAYMADPPETQVLSETVSGASSEMTSSDMATVGLVRRMVDSQLPAGVSTVAAGPLVVLGLVLDAVLAAGSLMLVPWVLLGIYMVGLLRGTIPLEVEGCAQPRPVSSNRTAPVLSSGSLKLPHLGDWTHDGHPVSHGQARMASMVAVRRRRPWS